MTGLRACRCAGRSGTGAPRPDPSDPSGPSGPSGQDQHQPEERSRLTPAPSITRLDEVLAFVREAGLPVDSDVRGSPTALSPGVDLTAYRIVQEALTNALRHAPGSTACVNVAYEADCVTVRITDTGAVPVSAAGPVSANSANGSLAHGYGLAGIAERVASCGGSLSLGPGRDGSFTVTARLPLT